MSFAPIFATLKAASAVTALIGTSPVRCYPAGEAPQDVVLPYATYQQVVGGPENYLNQAPDIDSSTTQIDIYAATVSSARAVFVACRNAVQSSAYVVAVREDGRDPDTNNVSVSFDVDWFTER